MAARKDPRVQIAGNYLAQRRTQRRPQHKFNLRLKPYALQPFMLAPVLPGESITNIMLQSQTWSQPLVAGMKNIGWWLQYNFFYVRHRDLDESVRNLLAQMMLDPDEDVSALRASAGDAGLYTYEGAIDWTKLCLQHVTENYFRDDGEDWNVATVDGLPAVQIYGRGTADALERLTLDTDYEDRRVDLIDADGSLYANDLNTMMGHWQAMRDAGLMEMDYEDFMRTYGSAVREDENSPNLHRAEDIWALREFTYPTNTVEPTTGVPAVAAGWRVQKSGGKRIFCDEPGFVLGVTNARPKVYLAGQLGSIAGMMDSVHKWLPAVLNDQADLGHVFHDADAGPLADVFAEGYWLDIRDLLLYGDQYVNYAVSGEPFGITGPRADGTRRYIVESQIERFFTGENHYFETDGLCSLSVQGRQKASTSGLVLGQA